MKKTIILTISLLSTMPAFCQSAAVKVRIEQLAKLELYLSYVKKGYDIVNKGLTLIGDIKRGDFNMHQDYFNSLGTVNPQIKSDAKIAAMVAMQIQMLAAYKGYYKQFQGSGVFTSQEMNYLLQVFSAVLSDVAEDITELTTVISDGQLQMKDDERMNRIDNLYTSMTGKYDFIYSFGDQVELQQAQRQKELEEIQHIQKLH